MSEMRKVSPWTQRALTRSLPYKVYADLRTDVRANAVPETQADMLRRTLPPVAEPERDYEFDNEPEPVGFLTDDLMGGD